MAEDKGIRIRLELDTSDVASGASAASGAVGSMAAEMESAAGAASSGMSSAEGALDRVGKAADKAAAATRKIGDAAKSAAKDAGTAAAQIESKLGNALKATAMQAANLAVNLGSAYAKAQGNDTAASYISGIGGAAIQGAQAGMAFGPWGALIGGLGGAALGGLTTYFGNQAAERQAEEAEAERAARAREAEQQRQRQIVAQSEFAEFTGTRAISRETDREALAKQIEALKDSISDTDYKLAVGLTDQFSADAANELAQNLIKAAEARLAALPPEPVEETPVVESVEGVNEPVEKVKRAASRTKADSLARIGGSIGGAGGISGTEKRLDLQTKILEQCRDAMRQVADYTRTPIATFA